MSVDKVEDDANSKKRLRDLDLLLAGKLYEDWLPSYRVVLMELNWEELTPVLEDVFE